jgi:hypothetical protein
MTNPNIIARTVVGTAPNPKYVVSTVRLAGALRLNLYAGRIFETMVFACDADGAVTDWLELDCQRYGTLVEARTGHNDMVQIWTNRS